MTPTFTDEPLEELVTILNAQLGTLAAGEQVTFYALDPDRGVGLFAGEVTEIGGVRYRHRPLRVWLEPCYNADIPKGKISRERDAERRLLCNPETKAWLAEHNVPLKKFSEV